MFEFQKLTNYSKITFILYQLALVIFVIGIFGNIMTFMVFMRKRYKQSSFAFYFKLIPISNSILLFHIFGKYLEHIVGSNIVYVSFIGCKFGYYSLIAFTAISVWLLLIISLDRLSKIINRIHKFALLHKPRFQISLVTFIFAFNLIIPIAIPLNVQVIDVTTLDKLTNTSRTERMCDCEHILNTSRWMTLMSASLAFCLLTVLTVISLYILFKTNTRSSKNDVIALNCRQLLGGYLSMVRRQNRKNRDRKYAINTIVLNVVCFACKLLPLIVFMILYGDEDEDYRNMIGTLVFIVFSIDNASLFFVNLSVNSIFREQFRLMLFKPKCNIPNMN
jgi:hypothetical protein